MFNNFTYKQKIVGLIFLAILLFLAAKKRSYSKAMVIYNQVKETEDKLKYIKNSNTTINELKNEINYYDSLIGSDYKSPEEIQQKILSFSNSFSSLEIIGISEIHEANSNDFKVVTNKLIVEGNYDELMNLIYEFEKSFSDAAIASIRFTENKKLDNKSGKIKTIIMFQNYEKDNY